MAEYLPHRPHICPDQTCRCIWTSWSQRAHQTGRSWDCVGKLETPHVFAWVDTEHFNTYCWCIYTPLKGVTKFFICPKDIAVFFGTLAAMMLQDEPNELAIVINPIVYALKKKGLLNDFIHVAALQTEEGSVGKTFTQILNETLKFTKPEQYAIKAVVKEWLGAVLLPQEPPAAGAIVTFIRRVLIALVDEPSSRQKGG